MLGVVILQFGMRSARRSAAFVLIGVAAVVSIVLGVGGDTPVGVRVAGNQTASMSDAGRKLLRDESFAIVHQRGITGVGLKYLFPPHNLVAAVLAATGITGFIGLLVVVLALIRRFIATTSTDTMALAMLSTALAMYASAWVVNVGWEHFFWLPVALVFGVALDVDRVDDLSHDAVRSGTIT